jgi:hypothetical protein
MTRGEYPKTVLPDTRATVTKSIPAPLFDLIEGVKKCHFSGLCAASGQAEDVINQIASIDSSADAWLVPSQFEFLSKLPPTYFFRTSKGLIALRKTEIPSFPEHLGLFEFFTVDLEQP